MSSEQHDRPTGAWSLKRLVPQVAGVPGLGLRVRDEGKQRGFSGCSDGDDTTATFHFFKKDALCTLHDELQNRISSPARVTTEAECGGTSQNSPELPGPISFLRLAPRMDPCGA